jgi:plasmid replication initiation protein
MWRRAGHFKINVDHFKDKLDVKPSQRANYKELRTRVIEPSLEEIKKKCCLIVVVTEIKKGRKVTDLHFEWSPDPQGKLSF